MKRMRWTAEKLLSVLLALFGFSACEGTLEYGCPIVDFQVKGQVADENGKAVGGIQVTIGDAEYGEKVDTVYTDAGGNFETPKRQRVAVGGYIHFRDIDGERNGGAFQPDSLDLSTGEQRQLKEGEGWYGGEFEVFIRKQLKREQSNTDER